MAAETRQHERAAHLLGAAERVRNETSQTLIELFRAQHKRSESAAVHGLGRRSLESAFARGRAMTISEGAAFAVEGKLPPKAPAPAQTERQVGLTNRELEITRLVADDLTNKQIAARLYLSQRTVATHITNILNKLGLSSGVQLGRWLSGLGDPWPGAQVTIRVMLDRHRRAGVAMRATLGSEETTMRYALLMHYAEPTWGEISEDAIAAAREAFGAYGRALEQAGVLLSADVLQPAAATTTVTRREGVLRVQDGPFAETKEALAGVFVLDVPDLDAAIGWAEKCPGGQWGVIEVRPTATAFVHGQWTS